MQSKEENKTAERRRHRRRAILAVATVNYGRTLIPCVVTNLSRGGAQIRLLDSADALPRENAELELRGIGVHPVFVVWQKGKLAGLKFAAEIALDPRAQKAA